MAGRRNKPGRDPRDPDYAVYPVKPVQAKEIRAQPFVSACEAGKVFLVQCQWNQAFLDEIDSVFGGAAAHDDQADAASGAHEILAAGEYGRSVRSASARGAGGRATCRGGSWTCRRRSGGRRRRGGRGVAIKITQDVTGFLGG